MLNGNPDYTTWREKAEADVERYSIYMTSRTSHTKLAAAQPTDVQYQDLLRKELASLDDDHPRALRGALARLPDGAVMDRLRGGALLTPSSRIYLR